MLIAGRLGVLEEREFSILWLGQAMSALGSSLVPVALAFAVIDLTGSASALGLVLSAAFVSRVVLLLVGGVVADRLPRQSVMLGADLLRTVSQGLAAGLLITGHARLWELVVLIALFGAGDAFFAPASTGLVPETVRAERLQQANALMSLSRSVALVAGPTIAGLLVTAVGPGWVFAIDAATFAVSSASLACLRLPRSVSEAPRATVLVELRDGWREVRSRTWVWATVVRFSLSNLAIAPLFVLGPFVAEESLGGATAWGLIGTAGGIGAVLGDAAALRLRPRRPLLVGGARRLSLGARAGGPRPPLPHRRDRRRGRARLRRFRLLERPLVHRAPGADPAQGAFSRQLLRLARLDRLPAGRLRACRSIRRGDRSVRDVAVFGGRSGLGLHRGVALTQRPSSPRSLAIR